MFVFIVLSLFIMDEKSLTDSRQDSATKLYSEVIV